LSVPTVNTTNISGVGGGGYFSGTATTYGSQNVVIPTRQDRYDQDGIFLRNVNDVIPLWERTKKQYLETSRNKFSGVWRNEDYLLELYVSGESTVAIILNVTGNDDQKSFWSQGDLKFIFNKDGGGIYLMGNRAPLVANFKINKFRNLEVEYRGGGESGKVNFALVEE